SCSLLLWSPVTVHWPLVTGHWFQRLASRLIFATFTSLRHFAISVSRCLVSAPGVLAAIVLPSLAKRSFTSGACSSATISRLRRSVVVCAVPPGARTAYHPLT